MIPRTGISHFPARSVIVLCGSLILLLLVPRAFAVESLNYEVNRLISAVGRNGCTFIRNGEKYRGRAAREHLRSKREQNEELVVTTEDFIEKIASTSATTGMPYLIQCRDQEERTLNDWFTELLEQYRLESEQSEDEN